MSAEFVGRFLLELQRLAKLLPLVLVGNLPRVLDSLDAHVIAPFTGCFQLLLTSRDDFQQNPQTFQHLHSSNFRAIIIIFHLGRGHQELAGPLAWV